MNLASARLTYEDKLTKRQKVGVGFAAGGAAGLAILGARLHAVRKLRRVGRAATKLLPSRTIDLKPKSFTVSPPHSRADAARRKFLEMRRRGRRRGGFDDYLKGGRI